MHRIGQQSAVNIHFLLARNTLDDMLWKLIDKKVTPVPALEAGAVCHPARICLFTLQRMPPLATSYSQTMVLGRAVDGVRRRLSADRMETPDHKQDGGSTEDDGLTLVEKEPPEVLVAALREAAPVQRSPTLLNFFRSPAKPMQDKPGSSGPWTCAACTFVNLPAKGAAAPSRCNMCSTRRPRCEIPPHPLLFVLQPRVSTDRLTWISAGVEGATQPNCLAAIVTFPSQRQISQRQGRPLRARTRSRTGRPMYSSFASARTPGAFGCLTCTITRCTSTSFRTSWTRTVGDP